MNLSPTLIHAGTEAVVVGAIAFYFYRKTSALEEKIATLEKRLEMYDKVLQGHEHFIRNMLRVEPPPAPAPAPVPPSVPTPPVQTKEPVDLDSLLKEELQENNGADTD